MTLTKKYLEDYSQKGYAIIRNVFSDDEIDEITLAIDAVKNEGIQYKSPLGTKIFYM